MRLEPLWVLRGYFDFSARTPTPSQAIRDDLARQLKQQLQIHGYPVGPAWRYAIWWREADPDYAEAQFFMRIPEFPVLSVGLSVEKGLEEGAAPAERKLDRNTWDWPRLVQRSEEILRTDVPRVASELSRPINLRVRLLPRGSSPASLDEQAFSFIDGAWFQRRLGSVAPPAIADYLKAVDALSDCWGIVHIAVDLAAHELSTTDTGAVANILVSFNHIRCKLRGAV